MGGDHRVQEATQRLLQMWTSGDMPRAIATATIRRQAAGRPCDLWSLGNQLLVVAAGSEDARGFRQWEQAGRHVRKGAKAICILGPVTRRITEEDPATGGQVERTIVRGFRGIPVFRFEDTQGERLQTPDYRPPVPLAEVAERWGLQVTYGAFDGRANGWYSPTKGHIHLMTHAERTLFHELAHAAHDRLGGLAEAAQVPRQEIVAETAAAALCVLYGFEGFVVPGRDYVAHFAGVGPDQTARAVLQHLAEIERVLELILRAAEACPLCRSPPA